jgi:carboxymethylenebutenolidase
MLESAMPIESTDLFDVVISPVAEGGSRELRGVLGIPEGPGPFPAVVVVHEVFGIEGEMRKQVAHLAALGYLAVMPDLFSQGGARRCLAGTMRALREGTGRAYVDIESTRQWILNRPEADGSVGILGFCMGGGFALMAAASGFDAAASNYGMLPRDLGRLDDACPIVGSYGAQDRSLRGAAAVLETALSERGVVHDIKEYPEANHVFMNEKLTGPLWLRPIVRVMGFGPHPESAADAWTRIDAFFGEHLTPTR